MFILFIGLRVDENVINEYYNKRLKVFTKDSDHEIHKCSKCIRETKWHNQELIMTITGTKSCFWDIPIPNPKLMIPWTKINPREETRPLELIEHNINSGKWILILYSDFVELPIIDTHFKGSILCFTNNTGASQGDMLGSMKPLSMRFCNCNFHSLSSAGAIL